MDRHSPGEAMRIAVYGAVLVITLSSVLLGLDWLSAPMSPMVDTQAGLRAAAPPPVSAPSAPKVTPAPSQPSVTPSANIGVPIVPPSLVPALPNTPAPVSGGASVQATPPATVTVPESEVRCNVDACTAAYRTFTASDCTYQPVGGPRKLCTK
ncbi:MAG TPA: BA14K family protein [Pseudolabrys sp.]|nr:BA14K family protein [Pseudolabrys sp.]